MRLTLFSLLLCAPRLTVPAQDSLLITNVRIFNGTSPELKAGGVLVVGGRIAQVGGALEPTPGVPVLDGGGRTLMPGLIDAHVHLTLSAIPMVAAMTAPSAYVHHVSGREAEATLMRGFTTVRDVGGPTQGLKLAVDQGLLKGPRIYPSGAMISQTGGHGDFRMPHEIVDGCGSSSALIEKEGIAMIADGPDAVRQ
ncbi:MAG: amidohydrolase family protein, partial [Flavobacteriales bacterium]|nr:amidohydrolase family protein [Flavobacteriales bacterium]